MAALLNTIYQLTWKLKHYMVLLLPKAYIKTLKKIQQLLEVHFWIVVF